MEVIRRFKKAIAGISEKDKVAIIYHLDADGIASACITNYALEKLGKKIEGRNYFAYGDFARAKRLIKKAKKKKITRMVAVDLNLDSVPADLDRLKFLKGILLIDHHRNFGLKKKNLTVIKADEYSKIPSSHENNPNTQPKTSSATSANSPNTFPSS